MDIDDIISRLNGFNTRCFILGLSGGLDSSVVAALAARSDKSVLGLIMPMKHITPEEDTNDAIELARLLGIDYKVIDITPIIDVYKDILPNHDKALANLIARVRMTILYYYSNMLDAIVLGTSDKSEYMLGYFTKYGDGAADHYPIIHLYKTEVKELAKILGIPSKIIDKPSAPRLYSKDHTAEKELGLSYDEIDSILKSIEHGYHIVDEKSSMISSLVIANMHKRMVACL